jgi:hypothetical protein
MSAIIQIAKTIAKKPANPFIPDSIIYLKIKENIKISIIIKAKNEKILANMFQMKIMNPIFFYLLCYTNINDLFGISKYILKIIYTLINNF